MGGESRTFGDRVVLGWVDVGGHGRLSFVRGLVFHGCEC